MIRNEWLITGPDTMPGEARHRLERLRAFHFLKAHGLKLTREDYLLLTLVARMQLRLQTMGGFFHKSIVKQFNRRSPLAELARRP